METILLQVINDDVTRLIVELAIAILTFFIGHNKGRKAAENKAKKV